MKISLLNQGQTFLYGGISWIKLMSDRDGVLAITTESIFERRFDENPWNCWSISILRKELNREFMMQLMGSGGKYKHFVPISIDLTAKDGSEDYGVDEDFIILLTGIQYLQYKHLIPDIKESCWTATPWSCKEEYLDCVCVIDANGRFIKEHAHKEKLGVRPLCKLKNTLQIELV